MVDLRSSGKKYCSGSSLRSIVSAPQSVSMKSGLGMSDDAEELSDYAKLRLERIKRNQARLISLGLDKPFSETFPKPVKRKAKSKKRAVKHGQERRSARLRRKAEGGGSTVVVDKEPVSLSYDSEDFIDDESKPKSRFRMRKFIDFEITQKELKALEKNIDENYLQKFREFLVYKNKISPQNERSVMRQVSKLASGEGVRYESRKYGWPEGCYFMKGKRVTPMSDIVELLNEAQKCEDKWGVDHGNGWLLRHPLKKLLLFQQFCLNNPAFLKSKCRLSQYCEVAKEMEGQQNV